jgi:hypothetical protein
MSRDSATQQSIAKQLVNAGVRISTAMQDRYLLQREEKWPWKKKRYQRPSCDIVILRPRIYVEVKGFMTIFAMAKLRWLTDQGFAYYVFQATEPSWNPWLKSPLDTVDERNPKMKPAKQIELTQEQQIAELVHYAGREGMSDEELLSISEISRLRLQNYFQRIVGIYRDWNGECP